MTVDPGERGALDLYVPLVDWGVRFEDTVRLPARLQVELRTVDRVTVSRVAQGESLDLQQVRAEARDAIAKYLRTLIAIVVAASLALGVLVAFALRHRSGPRLRYKIAAVAITALTTGVALVVLLPPRGPIDNPQYYAFGPDIPRALEAVESAQRSTRLLDQELDAQLVGLARLVTRPAERASLADRPRITIASDLHNNFLSIPILERAAGGRAAVLRRRSHRQRLAARGAARPPGHQARQAVRVRLRQPRFGQPRAGPRPPRRDRADGAG